MSQKSFQIWPVKTIVCVTLILAASAGAVLAQQNRENSPQGQRPLAGMGSKTMASCRQDIQRYCASAPAHVQKECLVKYWDNISSDCQDALGVPNSRGGD